jgi:hypothetical protein
MYKNASRSVCTSIVMVFLHPFSPTLLTSSAVRTPENTDEGSVDAEPADEGDIQMEYIFH